MGTFAHYAQRTKYQIKMEKKFMIFIALFSSLRSHTTTASSRGKSSISGIFHTMQREFDAQEANINALEGVDILTLAKKIEAVADKVEALAANPAGQLKLITENGTAGASNVYSSSSGNAAANAFKLDTSYWHSKKDEFPMTIWMRFQRPYRLKKIGVKPYSYDFITKEMYVVGSDDCTSWNPLLIVQNTGYPSSGTNAHHYYKEWTISVENRFSCLGLMFMKKDSKNNGHIVLDEIHMWEQT